MPTGIWYNPHITKACLAKLTQRKSSKHLRVFPSTLLEWFDQYGRKNLPWQVDKTPYRVWVSEIMLQQTQVTAVIGYYQNFMEHFPTLSDLAQADQENVLQHWAGLGYYARARNLHKTAQIVKNELQGIFPDTLDQLQNLPGIGRSTAGAILSIAFEMRAPILDGNVKRVLCRLNAIDSWPGERLTEQKLWDIAEQLTPETRVADYTQAIMDFGATLCTRAQPKCEICPMQSSCQAFELGRVKDLPKSKPKKEIPTKEIWVAYIENSGQEVLLEKRPSSGIWGGLYSLPEFSTEKLPEEVAEAASKRFGLMLEQIEALPSFRHTFSHYKLILKPLAMKAIQQQPEIRESDVSQWYANEQLHTLGLPTPIKKFLIRKHALPQQTTLKLS